MLILKKTTDKLAMANSVRWYGHMLREGGHVLRRALDFEVESQRKKGRQSGYGRNRLRKKVERWA